MKNKRGKVLPSRSAASVAVTGSVIIAIVAAGVGATIALAVAPESVPSSLAHPSAASSYPVTSEDTKDRRSVQLLVHRGDAAELRVASEGGIVTATTCSPGGAAASGTSSFEIDGSPLLSLSSTVPFWRDMSLKTKGPDVKALQAELQRLGYAVRPDGIYGADTARAVFELLADNRMTAQGLSVAKAAKTEFEKSRFIWIPAPTATFATCSGTVGSQVSSGAALATLESGTVSAKVASMPTDLLSGRRIVMVDGKSVPVDDQGTVTDPSQLAVRPAAKGPLSSDAGDSSDGADANASASQPASASDVTVEASLELSSAQKVWSVPASSLYGFEDDDKACVTSSGKRTAVRVVASRLGSSLVIPIRGSLGRTVASASQSVQRCG